MEKDANCTFYFVGGQFLTCVAVHDPLEKAFGSQVTNVPESFRFDESACGVWAERVGPTSGWTEIEVKVKSTCGSAFPSISDAETWLGFVLVF